MIDSEVSEVTKQKQQNEKEKYKKESVSVQKERSSFAQQTVFLTSVSILRTFLFVRYFLSKRAVQSLSSVSFSLKRGPRDALGWQPSC